jgi:Fusaric acid resistance protein-like
VSGRANLLSDITKLNTSALSFRTGFRAAFSVVSPLLVGLATGQPAFVFATLGALFVVNTEGPRATAIPVGMILIASFLEATMFGLGTLAGSTGLLAAPLLGIAVFAALQLAVRPGWAPLGTFSAIFFAVGVGLPGGSIQVAGVRLVFSLAGGLWVTFGAWLHRSVISPRWRRVNDPGSTRPHAPVGGPASSTVQPPVRSEIIRQGFAVAVASALGLETGIALGLPRDFWIVVTIILAIRPTIGSTVTFTLMIVIGTIIGAIVAAAITLEIAAPYVLAILLFAFAVAMFATRGVNLALVQLFLTPFIIILLNILYPGEWRLAESRILDVAIGGVLAIVTATIRAARIRRSRGRGGR